MEDADAPPDAAGGTGMRRWWLALLVLALPFAGLATTIARNEIALASADEWVIPVTGFDPRDPLRGRYIVFRYQWEVVGDAEQCRGGRCLICLERIEEGKIVAAILPRESDPPCPSRLDPEASGISPEFTGRIFVSETRSEEH